MTIDEIEELLKQHPVLKQICDGKAQYSLALTKLALKSSGGVECDIVEIEESLEFLRQSEVKYCREHNIPLDYAAPVYSCPVCEDKGWLSYDTKTGVMEHCKCTLDRLHKRLFRNSGLAEEEHSKRFDTFDLRYYGDSVDQERAKRVVARCSRFAADVAGGGHVSSGIGIIGSVGRGKTHLLLSVFNYIADNNPRLTMIYSVAADLLDDLRASYDQDAEVSFSEKLRTLVEADLLLLDDLGAEKWNEWVENTFFRIINGRLVRHKPFVFSTNLGVEDMCMVVGERIHSRIYSTCDILHLLGRDDIRVKRKFEALAT